MKRKSFKRTFIAEFIADVPEGDVNKERKYLKLLLENLSDDGFPLQKLSVNKLTKSGREKGFGFERKIAKKLSLWWTDGDDENVFVRRASSGGRKSDKSGESGYGGDIHADKEIGFPLVNLLSFELKHTKDMDPSFLLMSGDNPFADAWGQCLEDAMTTQRVPCLIYKREKIECICLFTLFIVKLSEYVNINRDLYFLRYKKIMIFPLDEFLDVVDPEIIKVHWKELKR